MKTGITYRITPLTLKEFEAKYGTSKLEYKKYLEENTVIHNYEPFETMLEWFEHQCTTRE